MVGQEKSKQLEGFDLNDYVYIDTSANPYGAANIGFIVAGQAANAVVVAPPNLASVMLNTLLPPAGIGPQYPWPYEGQPGQFHSVPANMPINPAHVQRTTFRVVNQSNINVWFVDQRLAMILSRWLQQNPAAAGNPLGPTGGAWPLPLAIPLYGAVGNYTFERKWVWLFYQRAVAGVDVDLEVYMWG